jgi:hypothetical protein
VNDELERMWMEAVVAQFKALGTEINHEKPQSGQPVYGSRFEHGTTRIQSTSVNQSTTTVFLVCHALS